MVLDEGLYHLVEAGSDFYLMPSIFEPCGLNQMYSQRYGTPPLASDVGGLHDTVVDIRKNEEAGTGLLFQPELEEFDKALNYSLELFSSNDTMEKMRWNGMLKDFSWKNVVKEYENLYLESL